MKRFKLPSGETFEQSSRSESIQLQRKYRATFGELPEGLARHAADQGQYDQLMAGIAQALKTGKVPNWDDYVTPYPKRSPPTASANAMTPSQSSTANIAQGTVYSRVPGFTFPGWEKGVMPVQLGVFLGVYRRHRKIKPSKSDGFCGLFD